MEPLGQWQPWDLDTIEPRRLFLAEVVTGMSGKIDYQVGHTSRANSQGLAVVVIGNRFIFDYAEVLRYCYLDQLIKV